jgi:hypothetical protein
MCKEKDSKLKDDLESNTTDLLNYINNKDIKNIEINFCKIKILILINMIKVDGILF